MRQAQPDPRVKVRGSSRRIMIMRFRPANISLINRRHYLPRLWLTLSQFEKRSAPLDPLLHIRFLARTNATGSAGPARQSQRQLPTDHDYAVPTREYQLDQSSPLPASAVADP